VTLITSISGIRGTIGGSVGDSLTPLDIIKFTSGYANWIKSNYKNKLKPKIVTGRDARISGPMVHSLVNNTLISLGIDVIDCGLSTTPSVEMAVPYHDAQGGIIITASHNPKQWNALKLLNDKGEFVSAKDGDLILKYANATQQYSEVNQLGFIQVDDQSIERHIDEVLRLKLVNIDAIAAAKFCIVVDAVNSTGGIAVPMLLKKLGVENVVELYCEPNGQFPHNPEPLPENLTAISKEVIKAKAHLGIVVDPDVDRLALVCEDGEMFGEEYTLVAVSDYVLKHQKGNTVSNLSSTRALKDITEKAGHKYSSAAVGEVNVVDKMKQTKAVIGGEGNGGVIYPELHYGRDALAGIALFLSHLALSKQSVSALRKSYPNYYISKNKIELTPEIKVDDILKEIIERYSKEEVDTTDGVKISFEKEWVHLRKSNTEPIIRIYAESSSETTASTLASKIISDIKEVVSNTLAKV